MPKNWTEARNEYNREKYDRIGLMLPKGKGEAWKGEAQSRGLSINAFVQKAVEFYLENSEKLDKEEKIV